MAIFMDKQGQKDKSKGLTATSQDIIQGKTAEVNNEIVTGSMPDLQANSNITLTSTNQTKVVLGNNVFTGTGSDGVKRLSIRYAGETGYLKNNTLVGISFDVLNNKISLTADKLAKNQTVLGVTGTYTSDATATTADIVTGKTAYVNGKKITGTATLAPKIYSQRVNSMICKLQPTVSNNYTIATTYSYGSSDTTYGGIYRFNHSTKEWTHPNSSYADIRYCKSLPNGVVVGLRIYNSASFVYSTNYGQTWATVSTGVTWKNEPTLMSNGEKIAIYGQNSRSVWYIAYTTNGSSWTTINLGSTQPYGYMNGDEKSGYFYGCKIEKRTEGTSYRNYGLYYRTKDFSTWTKIWSDIFWGSRSTTAKATHTWHCQGAYQFNNFHIIFGRCDYKSSSNNQMGWLYMKYSTDNGTTWTDNFQIAEWSDNYSGSDNASTYYMSLLYYKNKVYIFHPQHREKGLYNTQTYYIIDSSGITTKSFEGTVFPYCLSTTNDKIIVYYDNIVDYYDDL